MSDFGYGGVNRVVITTATNDKYGFVRVLSGRDE
jgi:hypothetical protein